MSEHTEPVIISEDDHMTEEPVPVSAQTPPPATVQVGTLDQGSPEVIEAPLAHGRSFVLRQFFNARTQIGQMLVLVNRNMWDAAIEVLETFLPVLGPARTFGQDQNRFYLGDLKITNEYLTLICEMKISHNQDGKRLFEYRLLYPSGKVLRKWDKLNLGALKLKTTAEQRAAISAFTGIVYKLRQADTVKQTNHPEHSRSCGNHSPRVQPRMGGLFERAGVKVGEVKHKLQENRTSNVTIRRDLQRGLPSTPPPEAVLPAGENLPATVPDPTASGDVADHGVRT